MQILTKKEVRRQTRREVFDLSVRKPKTWSESEDASENIDIVNLDEDALARFNANFGKKLSPTAAVRTNYFYSQTPPPAGK